MCLSGDFMQNWMAPSHGPGVLAMGPRTGSEEARRALVEGDDAGNQAPCVGDRCPKHVTARSALARRPRGGGAR